MQHGCIEILNRKRATTQSEQLACEQGEGRTEDRPGILRHGKISTTLDVYAQEDSNETRAAQGEFLTAVGMNATVH